MWIVLDIIIVAIILFYILISAKRGFIRTAVELVGFGLSIYLAFLIGGTVATAIYDGTVEPAIVDAAVSAVGEQAGTGIDQAVTKTWESLPGYVINIADNFGITAETLKENITSAAINTNSVEAIAEQAAETVVEPIIVPLIKTIVGILLFIILMVLVKFLAKIINRAFNLPLIGGLNRTLGGILGFGKGVLISAVFAILITTLVSFSSEGFLFFTMENIEESTIFGFLADFSPIK